MKKSGLILLLALSVGHNASAKIHQSPLMNVPATDQGEDLSVQPRALRDGAIVPKPKSGTQNDAAGTMYIFAPSNGVTVNCNFHQNWGPGAYIRYDADRRRVWISSGWPREWRMFQNATLVAGLPPFGAEGITVVLFGDTPVVSFRIGADAQYYRNDFGQYPIEAAWGFFPGMDAGAEGSCRASQYPFTGQARHHKKARHKKVRATT